MRDKFKKEMEACIDSVENKAINLAAYIQNLSVEKSSIQVAVKDMETRAQKLETKIEFLKSYLQLQLEACDMKEVTKSPYFVIKIKKNPPSVYINKDAKLDDEYVNVVTLRTPNKTHIKEHLDQGVVIQGCELKQTNRLEIK
jgi:hypothetical protein